MRLPNLVGLALMAGVGMSACAHVNQSGESAEDQAADDQAASELREYQRHHHRGSVTQFLSMSLDTIGADDAQRPQVEQLQASLERCLAPTKEIETKLVLTYADGLAAGALSTATIDEALEQLNATSGTVYECSVATMNTLHALLTPAEREVVADKVQSHWEIWREVNDEPEAGARARGSRLADLAEELDLTPRQVDQMSSALTAAFKPAAKFEAKKAEAHVLAFAAAFVFDKFDARSVIPDVSGRFAAHGARQMALFYETITPLLVPAQRAELAGILREHANHPTTVSAN